MKLLNKRTLAKLSFATLLAAGAALSFSGPASAYIACNRFGECWHVHHHYHYDPDLQVRYYDDDWYFHHDWNHNHDYQWRGDWHEDRGYWHNGVWVRF
jgi:hypothetical protein